MLADKPPDATAVWCLTVIYGSNFATCTNSPGAALDSILALSYLTPSKKGIPLSYQVHFWYLKNRMGGLQLVKVTWWSTQSSGYNTSMWQTHRQPHCHSKCCAQRTRKPSRCQSAPKRDSNYLVGSLIAAAVWALHCVAADNPKLPPHHYPRRRLLVFLNDETTAGQRERRRRLVQQLRQHLTPYAHT